MVDWIEYAIARHGAQLRAQEALRPLTEKEKGRLAVCEEVITRLESREAQPAVPRRALVNSGFRD